MRFGEVLCFGLRCGAEAVDVMMAVAFDMGHAEARGEQRVLLYRESRLTRQIFGGQHELLRIARDAQRMRERTVQSLARSCGNAAIAEDETFFERVRVIVGFVEDHRHVDIEALDRFLACDAARQRLLEQPPSLETPVPRAL